jgi:hypothetical protein
MSEINMLDEAIERHDRRVTKLRDFRGAILKDPTGPEAVLWGRALAVFQEPDNAAQWLLSQNAFLGGPTPIEMAQSEQEAVINLLGQIEYGVYS